MKKKSRLKRRKSKKFVLVVLFAAVAFIVVASLFVRGRMNSPQTEGNQVDVRTTSTQPSAQSDFTDGDEREPGDTTRENGGSASVVDNSGSISSSVDRSNPTVSSTGEITLFTPTRNSLVKNQIFIAGTSTLTSVSYRVVDSISGVIDAGELSVVNGQFSGTLKIETGASEGRLDVFGTQSNGNEFSNLAIALRFE